LIYTSRIIKASALIADAKVLLAEWDLEQSVAENLDRARRENILGKASRKRVKDVLRIFRQRYFDDADVGGALVTLAQGGALPLARDSAPLARDSAPLARDSAPLTRDSAPLTRDSAPLTRDSAAQWLDPLLYFYAAQNDRTLRDLVTEVIYPRYLAAYTDLPTAYVVRAIQGWVAEGKTTTRWNEGTIVRVAQGFMATLRDFGVLQGAVHKRIAPIYLPTPAFALIALWLQKRERSGDLVLRSDDWKLFFLPVEGVERFFIEAHQEHLLTYHAAGSVIRIEFPTASPATNSEHCLTEYAHVLLERAR
jgi:hypothetical protein